jgi:epoxyqueuosine reductase QueG
VARREGASGAAASIDVVALLEGSDEEVLAAMGRAYVAERNPDWVRRNALIVLGISDVRDRRAVDVARRYVHHANPVLREQAQWTLDRMGHSAGCKD